MNNFDLRASEWDIDKIHMDLSLVIAAELEKMITLHHSMTAFEYGAGTGILSFIMKDICPQITLMDSSLEMIKVCEEKKEYHKAKHIHPLWFNLEHSKHENSFDLINNQMVLHDVIDYEAIIATIYSLLNKEGFLAIADLFIKDGSFHGSEINVHKCFDPNKLSSILLQIGFKNIRYKKCFDMRRENGNTYPLFL